MPNQEFMEWAGKRYEDFKRKQEQYFKHIENQSDLDLIVLKGHLLIEGRVIEVFKEKLQDKYFKKAEKFSFSNKVVLLHEIVKIDSSMEGFFSVLEKLNNLRNDMAHKLEVKQLENRIRHICKLMYDFKYMDKKFEKDNLLNQFQKCVVLLAEMISFFGIAKPVAI